MNFITAVVIVFCVYLLVKINNQKHCEKNKAKRYEELISDTLLNYDRLIDVLSDSSVQEVHRTFYVSAHEKLLATYRIRANDIKESIW